MRSACLMLTIALGSVSWSQRAGPPCSQRRVDQETYTALTDQVYLYAPNIDKSDGGWKPFTVRALVGQYRPPLLLAKGFMKEADLIKLLSGRRDVAQYAMAVSPYNPKASTQPPTQSPPVSFKVGSATITARVVSVNPAAGIGVRSDFVLVEVCGL